MAEKESRGTLSRNVSANRIWQFSVWLCLLIAFSPVLLDLMQHLRENTWARTIIIFPWLVWVAARTRTEFEDEPSAPKNNHSTWIWLCCGLAIELLSIAGGSVRYGRVGLVIAAIGLCHGYGWARHSVALLFFWSLPIPRGVIDLISPELQFMLGKSVAALIPGLDFTTFEPLPTWLTSASRLTFSVTEQGASLVYGLAGIGWFQAVSKGRQISDAMLHSLQGALAAIPLGIVVMIIAGLLMRISNGSEVPQLILSQFGWVLVLGIGFCASVKIICSSFRRPRLEPTL